METNPYAKARNKRPEATVKFLPTLQEKRSKPSWLQAPPTFKDLSPVRPSTQSGAVVNGGVSSLEKKSGTGKRMVRAKTWESSSHASVKKLSKPVEEREKFRRALVEMILSNGHEVIA